MKLKVEAESQWIKSLKALLLALKELVFKHFKTGIEWKVKRNTKSESDLLKFYKSYFLDTFGKSLCSLGLGCQVLELSAEILANF